MSISLLPVTGLVAQPDSTVARAKKESVSLTNADAPMCFADRALFTIFLNQLSGSAELLSATSSMALSDAQRITVASLGLVNVSKLQPRASLLVPIGAR